MPPQAAADSDSSAAPIDKPVKRTKKKRKGSKRRNSEEEAIQDSVDQPVATVTALSTETDKPADNTTGWCSGLATGCCVIVGVCKKNSQIRKQHTHTHDVFR